jgi:hypothetical protein
MTGYERMKIQRRMRRRIRLVVEERRIAQAGAPQSAEAETAAETSESPLADR